MHDDRQKKTNYSLILVAVAFAAVVGIQFFATGSHIQQIPYSQFKALLADGKVRDLVISAEQVQGSMPDPKEPAKLHPFATTRVEDPSLVQQLEAKGIQYTGKVSGSPFGALLSWVLPMLVFFVIWQLMMRRVGMGGKGILSVGQTKARIVADPSTRRISFQDVAGIDEAREELVEIVEFLQRPAKFEQIGGHIPKGVLLVGAPGTGKTLLAKAVAGEAGVPFFSMSGSEFVEMFVGVGAARVRDLFAQAKGKAPCIIFIDELDALGKVRGFSPMGGHDEREQTLNQLLVEMDGFDTRTGVIIMGATNRPEILDPALLRPGRFDRQIVIDRPDLNGRLAILQIHAKGVSLGQDVDLRALAAQTPGFVGADLANIINEAALLAVRRGKTLVGMAELEESIERVTSGLEKKKRLISPGEKSIIAYHESGHAIAAASLPKADAVQRISIVPRGTASLGHTSQLPTEDRYLLSKDELEQRIIILLSGRAAEELAFGNVTTGAQNDLQRATDIARAMVSEYGMSEKLGVMAYDGGKSPFLTSEQFLPQKKEYSEQTAKQIDDEIHSILERSYDRARAILKEHRGLLDGVAARLLEQEVIGGQEFAQMVQESAKSSSEGRKSE
ncbi:MAG: ATP-dependent zinc metalloprotease FtsH [Spirochaetia bacterium]|jgi:cell division protease FtsH